MEITGKAPIKTWIERDKDEPLETKRWTCIVETDEGKIEVRFAEMSWAEAVTYRNMFDAIQRAATIGKEEFTLTFGKAKKPDFVAEDVEIKFT